MPKTYARCDCGKEMAPGNGCAFTHTKLHSGAVVKRTRCAEPECHDCNVKQGQLHHPGCDMERCANCGGQQIMCDC